MMMSNDVWVCCWLLQTQQHSTSLYYGTFLWDIVLFIILNDITNNSLFVEFSRVKSKLFIVYNLIYIFMSIKNTYMYFMWILPIPVVRNNLHASRQQRHCQKNVEGQTNSSLLVCQWLSLLQQVIPVSTFFWQECHHLCVRVYRC